jgi:hypothetical protein
MRKTHSKNKMSEQIWFKDPSILFASNTWNRFVPTKSMTTAESLNAVVRFTVYFSVLLFLSTGIQSYVLAIPAVMALSIALYSVFPNGTRIEAFTLRASRPVGNYTMPTAQNPFMNVLLPEILDNPNREDAAPTNRTDVTKGIEESFKQTSDIYMDTTDVFDQAGAMRTFHTLQSSKVPNDQDGFLRWMTKGFDAPDYSSAPPARGGKILSEGYVAQKTLLTTLPNGTTTKPSGVQPSMTMHTSSTSS